MKRRTSTLLQLKDSDLSVPAAGPRAAKCLLLPAIFRSDTSSSAAPVPSSCARAPEHLRHHDSKLDCCLRITQLQSQHDLLHLTKATT
jgi:hypothetical protein